MGFWTWLRPRQGAPEAPRAPDAPAPSPAPPAATVARPAGGLADLPPPGAPVLALSRLDDAERRRVLLRAVVDPTLAWLAGMGVPSDDRARVMLLAIAGQESAVRERRQRPVAHAMGLWQFERGGGVAGVLTHRATMARAGAVCAARRVEPTASAVHAALERDDVLASAFARLLLWSDPRPLPGMAEELEAWRCYVRIWRPGAYLRPPWTLANLPPPSDRWAGNHRLARSAVLG